MKKIISISVLVITILVSIILLSKLFFEEHKFIDATDEKHLCLDLEISHMIGADKMGYPVSRVIVKNDTLSARCQYVNNDNSVIKKLSERQRDTLYLLAKDVINRGKYIISSNHHVLDTWGIQLTINDTLYYRSPDHSYPSSIIISYDSTAVDNKSSCLKLYHYLIELSPIPLCISPCCMSNEDTIAEDMSSKIKNNANSSEIDTAIYSVVPVMPKFPGSYDDLFKFLTSNLNFPDSIRERGITGRVIVQFVVLSDGTIGNVKLSHGIHPILDREALCVVKMLPKYEPGKINGRPVNVLITMPIPFGTTKF